MPGAFYQTRVFIRALRSRGFRPRVCLLGHLAIALCVLAGAWAGVATLTKRTHDASGDISRLESAVERGTLIGFEPPRLLKELPLRSVFCVDDFGSVWTFSPESREILEVGSGEKAVSIGDAAGLPQTVLRALDQPAAISTRSQGVFWVLGSGGEAAGVRHDGTVYAWFETPGPDGAIRDDWLRKVTESGLRGTRWPDDIDAAWPPEPPVAVTGMRLSVVGEGDGQGPAALLIVDSVLDASGYCRRFALYGEKGEPLSPFRGFRFDPAGKVYSPSGHDSALLFDDALGVPAQRRGRPMAIVLSHGKGGCAALEEIPLRGERDAASEVKTVFVPGEPDSVWLAGRDRKGTTYLVSVEDSPGPNLGGKPAVHAAAYGVTTSGKIAAYAPIGTILRGTDVYADPQGNLLALVADEAGARLLSWKRTGP